MTTFALINDETRKPDPRYPGMTRAVCEGGAGWLDGKHVAEWYVGGWKAYAATLSKQPRDRLYPLVDDAALAKYLDAIEPGTEFCCNAYEDGTYGPNRLIHVRELNKILAAGRARKLVVSYWGWPHANGTDAEDDYTWRKIKANVDRLAFAFYFGYPDGPITPAEHLAFLKQVRKVDRLAGTTKDKAVCISPQTHAKVDVSPEKMKLAIAMVKELRDYDLFIWSVTGNSPANRATAAAAMGAVVVD